MEHVILSVQGMTCGGCANTIEKHLGKLEGVESVKAQADGAKVDVSFEPGVVTLEQITAAIQDSGYEVTDQPKVAKPSCSCCK